MSLYYVADGCVCFKLVRIVDLMFFFVVSVVGTAAQVNFVQSQQLEHACHGLRTFIVSVVGTGALVNFIICSVSSMLHTVFCWRMSFVRCRDSSSSRDLELRYFWRRFGDVLLLAAFVLQAHTAIVVVAFVALFCFSVAVSVACVLMSAEVLIVRSLMFVCLCIILS